MAIHYDISLKPYNTFNLDYKANCVAELKSEDEMRAFIRDRDSFAKPFLIVGCGSNMLFTSDFPGTIIVPTITSITAKEIDNNDVVVTCGAGVRWDSFVQWCVDCGLYGLENLSLIPGMVGSAAVQNIGAYGVEAKDYILLVKALSLKSGSSRSFKAQECQYEYRDSAFKHKYKGKYMISYVSFLLSRTPSFRMGYGSLKQEVEKLGEPSLHNVRRAVIDIRRQKLPDPEVTGNAGSFFKNPIVDGSFFDTLIQRYPDIPHYDLDGGRKKIPAGWLIEQCGWKGKRIGNVAVHDKQALVIINCGGATGEEIMAFSEDIRRSIANTFNINIEREVEVIFFT